MSFVVERHGAVVLGSSLAEVQEWTVNLEVRAARYDPFPRKKRIRQIEPALDVDPIAQEVVKDILDMKKDSKYLQWKSNEKVKVRMGEIIPKKFDSKKQTLAGRRKRLREKIEKLLLPKGWHKTSTYNTYEKKIV